VLELAKAVGSGGGAGDQHPHQHREMLLVEDQMVAAVSDKVPQGPHDRPIGTEHFFGEGQVLGLIVAGEPGAGTEDRQRHHRRLERKVGKQPLDLLQIKGLDTQSGSIRSDRDWIEVAGRPAHDQQHPLGDLGKRSSGGRVGRCPKTAGSLGPPRHGHLRKLRSHGGRFPKRSDTCPNEPSNHEG
jgi:hypothetical protein